MDLSAEPIQVEVFALCSIAPVGGFLAGLDCKLLRMLLQVPLQAGCQGCGAAGCCCCGGQSRCGNESALAMAVPCSIKALPCCVFDERTDTLESASCVQSSICRNVLLRLMRRPRCNDFSLCLSWLTAHHLCKRAGEAAAMVQLMAQTAMLAGRAFQSPPSQTVATGGQGGTTASSGGGGYGAHLYGDSYENPQSFTSASLQQRGGGNVRAPAAAASRSGHSNAAQAGEAGLVGGLAAPPARGAAMWGMLPSKREGACSACAVASALHKKVMSINIYIYIYFIFFLIKINYFKIQI